MRFVCLGYFDAEKFESHPIEEQQGMMDKCFDYDDELRRGGHFVGGQALQGPQSAVTLHLKNGQVQTMDGPFVETKEYLGGLLFLEARDLNHAIALISKHPGLAAGPFEIRPVDEEVQRLISQRDALIRSQTKS